MRHCLTALLLGMAAAAAPAADLASAVPGEVLVKLARADALPPLLVRHGLSLAGRLGPRPVFRLRVAGNADLGATIAALQADPDVQVAEPNVRHRSPEAQKNLVWAIGSAGDYVAQWAHDALRLPAAHALADGRGVRVAVLDTGIDAAHPLFAGRLVAGADFVDGDDDPSEAGTPADPGHGHGTHVAGLVLLAAPQARVMPLRVLDPRGTGTAWALAQAMLHAVDPDRDPATDDGAQVINLSLAGRQRTRLMDTLAVLATCSPPDPADPAQDLSDPGYAADHARCARAPGALVVAAAGNDGSAQVRRYPAAESAYGLLAVTASTAQQRLADFANRGRWVEVAAPGAGITSALPGGAWGSWSGTSMAAPLAAGVAALLRSRAPALDARQTQRCLERRTRALAGTDIGQVDAAGALAALAASGAEPRCR